jgi:hypothetical protein
MFATLFCKNSMMVWKQSVSRLVFYRKSSKVEDRTVKKVRRAASAASNQAQQLLATKIKDIQTTFDETTTKLQRCRKLMNFVEKDLEEMRNTFTRLQHTYDQITQPSSMKLCIDGSEQLVWETLIYTVNESIERRAPPKCLFMLHIELYHLINIALHPLRIKTEKKLFGFVP